MPKVVNDKETLDAIKFHKAEAKKLKDQIKKLEGEMNKHRRLALDLDEARSARLKSDQAKKNMKILVSKQNMIINAIRYIDKVCTAGDICEYLGKKGLLKIESSQFAAYFGDAILKDNRILIEKVNATFRRYSLSEWNWDRQLTKRAQKGDVL